MDVDEGDARTRCKYKWERERRDGRECQSAIVPPAGLLVHLQAAHPTGTGPDCGGLTRKDPSLATWDGNWLSWPARTPL